jgi:hypothetical protein
VRCFWKYLCTLVSHGSGDYFLAPIRAVRQNGILAATFKLGAAWPDAVGRGVFVDRDGNVYQAALAPGGVYVVQFDRNGSVESKIKIETQGFLDPWHLVVYQSGRFLLSGTEGKGQRTPYAGIFERDGKLLKRIFEPEDEDARTKAESGDTESTGDADKGNRFVDLGDVSLGADGNAYLLHGTSPPLIYVISQTGEVIRKIRIGSDSAGLAFRSIAPYAGRIALAFAKFGHIEVRVTDLDGAPVNSYQLNIEKSGVPRLACYDEHGFTFITTAPEGSVHLLVAKP